MASDIVAVVLLGFGLIVVAIGALGVAVLRGPYSALHASSVGTMLGTILIGAAVVVKEGIGPAGLKTLLLIILMLIISPIITHATGRAARLRELGSLPGSTKEGS